MALSKIETGSLDATLDLSSKTLTLPSDYERGYVHLNTTSSSSDVSSIELRHFDSTTYKRYLVHFRFESSNREAVYFRYLTSSSELNGSDYSGFASSRRSDEGAGMNDTRFDASAQGAILDGPSSMRSSSKPDSQYTVILELDINGPDSYPYKVIGSGQVAGDNSSTTRYGYMNVFGSYYDTDSPTIAGVKFFRSAGNFSGHTVSIYGLYES